MDMKINDVVTYPQTVEHLLVFGMVFRQLHKSDEYDVLYITNFERLYWYLISQELVLVLVDMLVSIRLQVYSSSQV